MAGINCQGPTAPAHDRAFGFAYVSGHHPDFSVREIDRCVRDGPMVGVKLWVARKCAAAELDPIIERAAALKGVIFQHTWIKITGVVLLVVAVAGIYGLSVFHKRREGALNYIEKKIGWLPRSVAS